MKKGCIFDLDGTLINSLEDLANACNDALEKMNCPQYPIEDYKLFVGSGVKNLVKRTLPEYLHSQENIEQMLMYFYQHYDLHCLDHTKPYPNILELIDILLENDFALAVVTNKPDYLAKKIVNVLFDGKIEVVYGQVDDIPVKPNPTLIFKAIERLNIDKQTCFYIGDSDVDIYTAKNADLKSIGCLWGNRKEEELKNAGAMSIAREVMDIADIVLKEKS